MGPLSALLSLPVSGPMSGLTWLARQIEKAALQEMLDPARIETALLALERRLESGEIDEATFEAEEERLLEELSEITALRAAETATDDDEETSDDDETTKINTLKPVTGQTSTNTVMAGPQHRPEAVPSTGAGRPPTTWQPSEPSNVPQEEDAWTPA